MNSRVILGDALSELKSLSSNSVDCCVTSPPYWGLRDYGVSGQLGLESTPDTYVEKVVAVLAEVRRVLRPEGSLWLNLGDCYATGAGKVGECPGGGTRGKAWKKKGPSTPPNRMPIPGLKPKDLVGIPWRVALALQRDGWYLRSDIVWHKPNPLPESVEDRPTKAHEYLFLLTKSGTTRIWRARDTREWSARPDRTEKVRRANGKLIPRWKGYSYFYDADAVKEPCVSLDPTHPSYRPNSAEIAKAGRKEYRAKHAMSARSYNPLGRNRRTVWTVTTKPFRGAHFATFPEKLVEPCIRAGCPSGGLVLDPFCGSGTVGVVANANNRRFIGIELNPKYCQMARSRIGQSTRKLKMECTSRLRGVGLEGEAA